MLVLHTPSVCLSDYHRILSKYHIVLQCELGGILVGIVASEQEILHFGSHFRVRFAYFSPSMFFFVVLFESLKIPCSIGQLKLTSSPLKLSDRKALPVTPCCSHVE